MMGPTPQVVLKISEAQIFSFPDYGDVKVQGYVSSIEPGVKGKILVTIQPEEVKPKAFWKPGESND